MQLDSPNKSWLSSAISCALTTNDWSLCKDTGASVVSGRECDAVLIVLTQVEVPRKPSLNTSTLSHDFNKTTSWGATYNLGKRTTWAKFTNSHFKQDLSYKRKLTRVVKPATSVDNVIFLQHSKPAAHGRSMWKNENLPSILSLVSIAQVFEPINLTVVDEHFVRSVLRITE